MLDNDNRFVFTCMDKSIIIVNQEKDKTPLGPWLPRTVSWPSPTSATRASDCRRLHHHHLRHSVPPQYSLRPSLHLRHRLRLRKTKKLKRST